MSARLDDLPMKRAKGIHSRGYGPSLAVLVLALGTGAFLDAQSRWELEVGGGGVGGPGQTISVPIYVSTTDPLQGLVAVIEWDEGAATGMDLDTTPLVDSADMVARRIAGSYMALAVIMDVGPPLTDDVIPPGSRTLLFEADLLCTGGSTTIRFVDSTYSMVNGGPLLENYVIVGGIDISAAEGLILTGGTASCDTLPSGMRLPGDCNADGRLDISDGVCVLGVLFLGVPPLFPCGDGTPAHPGNVSLVDWQPDGPIDISDATALLQFLFFGSQSHPAAVPGNEIEGCAPLPGCSDGATCS